MRVQRVKEKDVQKLEIGDVISFGLAGGEKVKVIAVHQDGDNMIMCFVNCLEKECIMNPRTTTDGGWEGSELRRNLNSEILDRFPGKIHIQMMPFENGDLLTIPSMGELFEGKRWELMKERKNRTCKLGQQGEYGWYWLRDVVTSNRFACVSYYGSADYDYATFSLGVRPVFQIRNL